MNYKTHRVGGICSGLLVSTVMFSNNLNIENIISSGIIIAGATVGSLAPDIDMPNTKVGRKFLLKPISILIYKIFGHRTITHSVITSILMTVFLMVSTNMIGFSGILKYIYSNLVIGFCTGWMSHLALDIITVDGIPVYYPIVKKKYNIMKFKTKRDNELVSMLTILLTGIIMAIHFI